MTPFSRYLQVVFLFFKVPFSRGQKETLGRPTWHGSADREPRANAFAQSAGHGEEPHGDLGELPPGSPGFRSREHEGPGSGNPTPLRVVGPFFFLGGGEVGSLLRKKGPVVCVFVWVVFWGGRTTPGGCISCLF